MRRAEDGYREGSRLDADLFGDRLWTAAHVRCPLALPHSLQVYSDCIFHGQTFGSAALLAKRTPAAVRQESQMLFLVFSTMSRLISWLEPSVKL